MDIIIFDTETTGLLKHPKAKIELQPYMVEFGAVKIDHTGKQLGKLNLLCNPNFQLDDQGKVLNPLEEVITKITGLKTEDLVDQPKFPALWPQIRDFFSGCQAVVAHNLPFDKGIIDLQLRRMEVEDFAWPEKQICTVQESMPMYGYRVKMLNLYEDVIGKPLAQTHRAQDDCEALAEIFINGGYLDALNSSTES